MGKYTSVSISGYNSVPPADDGTVSEANKVKWSTKKTKLTDPLKTAIEAVNTNLVSAFDLGPTALTTSTTLAASRYGDFIQTSGASLTHTLTDAATLGAGWHCRISSTDANNVTIARATGTDTINGSAVDVTLKGNSSCLIFVNAAANGFIFVGNAASLGSNTFTDIQTLSSANPQYAFIETDATADNRRYDILATGESIALRVVNDANSSANEILSAQRTGTTVDSVTIGGTTVSVGGTLSSTKAAASGFTRMTPNFCMRTDVIVTSALPRDTEASISIPSGATALLIYVTADAKSNNAVASRYTVVQGQQQTGLETTPAHCRVLAMAYEHVAVAAGTTLATNDGWIILQAATPYLVCYDDTGNQGTAAYQVRGYWD